MRVLQAAAARRLDQLAIEQMKMPGLVLMENACRGATNSILKYLDGHRFDPRVLVLCGPGNNGGDGLGVARHLATRGVPVSVWLGASQLAPDAQAQADWCRRLGLHVSTVEDEPSVTALVASAGTTLVVDALFGTGLSRPLEAPWSQTVEEVNRLHVEQRVEVVALDLPSGLDADRGAPPGPHVEADLTITFAAYKPACLLSPAAEVCGEVQVVGLGLPLDELLGDSDIDRLDRATVRQLVPKRAAGSHKGDFGHLLVVGGSKNMSGAPALTALAALRSGVGLATVAAPGACKEPIAAGVPEAMSLPLGAAEARHFAAEHLADLLAMAERVEAQVIGPGLGQDAETTSAVVDFVLRSDLPAVLDADGLNAFSSKLELLAARTSNVVLTPHAKEMARLLDCEVAEVVADPLGSARKAADLSRQVVLLKGAGTVVAAPHSRLWIVREGSSALATAGSGDVLSGIVGAMLAQGVECLDAALVAAWVHGRAGRAAAAEISEAGVIASDLPRVLGQVWADL